MNMICDYEFDAENINIDTIKSIDHLNKKRKAETWQDIESGYLDRQYEDDER
jgi:hypothetical protein